MKAFVKTFSLYGIVPVANKLVGFFLIPVYTRVFAPEDFGVLEMFRTAAMFAVFLVHLQIYTAVSRYFFEYKEFDVKKKLVSTGLWFTVLTGILVCFLTFSTESFVLNKLFGHNEYKHIYKYVILWIPLTALNSYFNVMMRLIKAQNYFVIFSIIQMILRVSSIILFVVVLKMGVVGVFMGQIVGALTGIFSFGFKIRKYISFTVNWYYVLKFLKFSMPLVPGLLLMGADKLIVNYLIQDNLSYHELGLYSIAIRLSGALMIIHEALRLAWRPYLYELINKQEKSYKSEVASIYKLILAVLVLITYPIILFGEEIIKIIAGTEYLASNLVLGFVLLGSILRPLKLIVGIGPEITKKTYYMTVVEIFHFLYTVFMITAFIRWFGFLGVGITIFTGELMRFVLLWLITHKQLKLPIPVLYTFFTFLFIILTNLFLINMDVHVLIRILVLISFSLFIFMNNKLLVQKSYLVLKGKMKINSKSEK